MDKLSAEGSETRLVRIEGIAPRGHSRRVWDREVSGDHSPHLRGKKSHFNRLAKYTLHHVPEPSSRCASAMVRDSILIQLHTLLCTVYSRFEAGLK